MIKFYTREEVQNLLGVSKGTVDTIFADREFPAVTVGKRHVVEENALKNYFSKRRD